MQRTNPDIDIILDVLRAMQQVQPHSVFINSLHQQYCERGSLSKKQLEGLYSKASKVNGIHPGKLATLQAIIMKKPTKYKSSVPADKPVIKTDDQLYGEMIHEILTKYPEHKRVLYLKARFENHDVLSPIEKSDLERFYKLLGI